MANTKITLDDNAIELAYYLTGREELFENSLSQCSQDSRAVGILGEMAATEYLRGLYGKQRSVVPMGLAARTGGGYSSFGMGDVITVRNGSATQKRKEVHTFEVKSRTAGAGKGNMIRCDHAEQYADNGVTAVIFVEVDITPQRAICEIVKIICPFEISLAWPTSTNGMGQECYLMPTV